MADLNQTEIFNQIKSNSEEIKNRQNKKMLLAAESEKLEAVIDTTLEALLLNISNQVQIALNSQSLHQLKLAIPDKTQQTLSETHSLLMKTNDDLSKNDSDIQELEKIKISLDKQVQEKMRSLENELESLRKMNQLKI